MNELKQSQSRGVLPIISVVTFLGFLDTHLLIPVMALYASGLGASVGIAYGTLFPSISALVADQTLPEERGMATGIFHALLTAGVAIGAPIMGWVGGITGVELGLALSASILVLALAV